jgi:DNA-binding response OmpR family regulator
VLTDLHMPEMDGLELVQAIRVRHSLVPVILMTAQGSEDIAIEALQKGAASYIPKKSLDRDLAETVQGVLDVHRKHQQWNRVLGYLARTENQFVLDNDPSLVPALIENLQGFGQRMKGLKAKEWTRVSAGLREALLNAIYHGNLEMDSALRALDERAYRRLAAQRRLQAPYRNRRVTLTIRETTEEAVFIIRDEGPGFDLGLLPDLTNPVTVGMGGRGFLLIYAFMDAVSFNSCGNEITLAKRLGAT